MKPRSLITLEKGYSSFWLFNQAMFNDLKQDFKSLKSDEELIRSNLATHFILMWMREHYQFQKKFDSLFLRGVAPPASDQFTAAVGIALQCYLSANGYDRCVQSEKCIRLRAPQMRPDITVWAGDNHLVSVTECKTQLGWNRSGWKGQYNERTQKLSSEHPGSLSFLCVLTNRNWKQTWPDFAHSDLAGKFWFCLSNAWPSEIPEKIDASVIHPIEPMLLTIKVALNSLPSFRLI